MPSKNVQSTLRKWGDGYCIHFQEQQADLESLWFRRSGLVSGPMVTFTRILAVPSTALFWTESSDVVPGNCSSHSLGLEVTAPSAPRPMVEDPRLRKDIHTTHRSEKAIIYIFR